MNERNSYYSAEFFQSARKRHAEWRKVYRRAPDKSSVVFLVMTLHNLHIVDVTKDNAEEYDNRINEFTRRQLETVKRKILDGHRRKSFSQIARLGDKSRGHFSKERHRHGDSHRTQWVRARRAR